MQHSTPRLITQAEKELVQERLVLSENLHDQAVIILRFAQMRLLAHGGQEVKFSLPLPATPSCNADLLVAEELCNGGPKLRRSLLNPAGSNADESQQSPVR